MTDLLDVLRVHVRGEGPRVLVLANGFCTTQTSWDAVAAQLPAGWRVIRFDYVGTAGNDTAWDPARHAQLTGHAEDVQRLLEQLEVRDAVFVGHSMSAMVGTLVRVAAPKRIARLVMLGASPRYIDDVGYWGGFTQADVDRMIDAANRDLEQWIAGFAPIALGEHATATHTDEYIGSLVRQRPDIALATLRMVFEIDMRAIIPQVDCPVDLLQSYFDAAVPPIVGVYLQKRLRNARLDVLPVNGHVPHVTHAAIVSERLNRILRGIGEPAAFAPAVEAHARGVAAVR